MIFDSVLTKNLASWFVQVKFLESIGQNFLNIINISDCEGISFSPVSDVVLFVSRKEKCLSGSRYFFLFL